MRTEKKQKWKQGYINLIVDFTHNRGLLLHFLLTISFILKVTFCMSTNIQVLTSVLQKILTILCLGKRLHSTHHTLTICILWNNIYIFFFAASLYYGQSISVWMPEVCLVCCLYDAFAKGQASLPCMHSTFQMLFIYFVLY